MPSGLCGCMWFSALCPVSPFRSMLGGLVKRLDAREKVKLLAGTYLDAAERGKDDGDGLRSPFQSSGTTIHRRHGDLWPHGSYAAFELATNALRTATTRRGFYIWFWRVYVVRNHKLDDLAAHKQHGAEQGLTFITAHVKKSTGGNIYVPLEVAENAGWTRSDAKGAERPRKLAA